MRFRRKKGGDEEVVTGEYVGEHSWVPADEAQDDTVDMEAVAPATAAGGATREEPEAPAATDAETEERRAIEEARLADEELKRQEAEAKEAEAKAKKEADEAAKARQEAERAAAAQREASQWAAKEREEVRAAEPAATSVSGAGVMSPGLGADASPSAAAAANNSAGGFSQRSGEQTVAMTTAPAGGALAPILNHPAVQKKPELLIVGGIAAGFVLAKILKSMTSSGE